MPVAITTATKINRRGDHNAADLKMGDKVNIQARSCPADLANGATPTLTATRVVAHPSTLLSAQSGSEHKNYVIPLMRRSGTRADSPTL